MNFDANDRAVFGRLADVLIPSGDGFPSASQAGVANAVLDEVLAYRPELAVALKQIIALASDRSPAQAVSDLKVAQPALYAALTDFVPGAYFLNAQVRAKLSYRGQEPHPIGTTGEDVDPELLRSVIDRGPIYRPTPDRTASSSC